jgi:hypothetical protein
LVSYSAKIPQIDYARSGTGKKSINHKRFNKGCNLFSRNQKEGVMTKQRRRIRIKEIFCYLLLMFAVFGLSPCAYALDTVVGLGGSWQTWAASNETGPPYWAHTSDDGFQKNVGYYLTNSGFFSGGSAGPGPIPYFGTTAGGATAFSLTSSGASQAAMKIEIAGNANLNVFGWYDTLHPLILNPIFSGPASAGATATFIPSASYGFYITTAEDGTFTTESSEQHFAIFMGSDGYWLGMEDLAFSHSDKDYNDMIVKVSPVPEPLTLLLLGAGLVGLAGLRRKN